LYLSYDQSISRRWCQSCTRSRDWVYPAVQTKHGRSRHGTLYRSIRNTATLVFESTRKTGCQSLSSCAAMNGTVPERRLERNRVGTLPTVDHRIGSSRGHLPAKSHHDNNRCRRRFDKRQVYFVFRSTCGCCRKKEERGAITGTVWK